VPLAGNLPEKENMKTLEQLAKEFVCNVGREPIEKQEMEIKALVMFGKAVIKECQLTPVAGDGASCSCPSGMFSSVDGNCAWCGLPIAPRA
jgi:hypothetical protein